MTNDNNDIRHTKFQQPKEPARALVCEKKKPIELWILYFFKSWKNSWIICLSVEREQNWKHFYENVSISEMSLTLSTGNNFRESKTVPSTYQLPFGSPMIYRNIISDPFKKISLRSSKWRLGHHGNRLYWFMELWSKMLDWVTGWKPFRLLTLLKHLQCLKLKSSIWLQ